MTTTESAPTPVAGFRVVHDDLQLDLATPDDAQLVRDLDDQIFPPDSDDLERAPAGELESGVRQQGVQILRRDGRAVGYLHLADAPWAGGDRIYISGFGIVPSLQGSGLGRLMLHRMNQALDDARDHSTVVYTVTSPRNTPMLRLLLTSGRFGGRWVLPDFFGPSRDRVGLQQLAAPATLADRDGYDVAAADVPTLKKAVDNGDVIAALSKDGAWFRLVAGRNGDFLPCPTPS